MTPYEKTLNYIIKMKKHEQDKWDAGMKNQYLEWSNFLEDFEYAFEQEEKRKQERRKKMTEKDEIRFMKWLEE